MKAYIYPPGQSAKSSNPYISDLIESLSYKFDFINKYHFSKIGILDLFFHINKIDIVFLNWVEDIPDKRSGIIQSMGLIICLILLRLRGKLIFYTLHNKESHYNSNIKSKKFIRKFVLNKATIVLTHTTEGVDLLKSYKIKGKILYIPHPFKYSNVSKDKLVDKNIDVLIWGAIRPYKDIHNYLRFLKINNLANIYQTLIIGKIHPPEYENQLRIFETKSIKIVNEFVTDPTLNEYINKSRVVLFTYNDNSILSSGALIYSVSQGANIIGPNVGSFRDLHKEGLIEVFEDYFDLMDKLKLQINNSKCKNEKLISYINKNTWEKFGNKVVDFIINTK